MLPVYHTAFFKEHMAQMGYHAQKLTGYPCPAPALPFAARNSLPAGNLQNPGEFKPFWLPARLIAP
jgi:hypothetical protein